jgi:hypothetical protein
MTTSATDQTALLSPIRRLEGEDIAMEAMVCIGLSGKRAIVKWPAFGVGFEPECAPACASAAVTIAPRNLETAKTVSVALARDARVSHQAVLRSGRYGPRKRPSNCNQPSVRSERAAI